MYDVCVCVCVCVYVCMCVCVSVCVYYVCDVAAIRQEDMSPARANSLLSGHCNIFIEYPLQVTCMNTAHCSGSDQVTVD